LVVAALALLLDRIAVWLLSPPSACTDLVPWFPRSLVSVLALALLLDRIAVWLLSPPSACADPVPWPASVSGVGAGSGAAAGSYPGLAAVASICLH
jgi:hypothetical protein